MGRVCTRSSSSNGVTVPLCRMTMPVVGTSLPRSAGRKRVTPVSHADSMPEIASARPLAHILLQMSAQESSHKGGFE